MSARLVEREDLTDTLAVFRVEPSGGVPRFEPGQFVVLGLDLGNGGPLWRSYSIASPPEETRWFELYVRWVRAPSPGRFTTALWEATPGATLLWKPPRGRFTLASTRPDGSPDARRIVLLAAGTGLAPFVSMLRHLATVGCDRELVLAHAASHVAELGYRRLLNELAEGAGSTNALRGFTYVPSISRPEDPRNAGWTGATGRVEALVRRAAPGQPAPLEQLLDARLEPDTTCVYACGLDGTVRAILAALAARGFRTHAFPHADGSFDLHHESYG